VFSIETQTTIGYGAYKIEEGCNLGVSALVLQSVVSSLLDAGLLGLVFAKLARPRSRRNTILYSEKACIAQAPEYNSNDGDFYLTFRLGDIRKSHILEAHVRAQVYFKSQAVLPNGRTVYPFDCFELDIGYDTGRDRIFMLFPVEVRHHITEGSPLWGIGPRELDVLPREIGGIMEGPVEALGNLTIATTSYVNEEILFQRRFAPMVSIKPDARVHVNFELLNKTVRAKPPLTGKEKEEDSGRVGSPSGTEPEAQNTCQAGSADGQGPAVLAVQQQHHA
jgi:hypothetical protein